MRYIINFVKLIFWFIMLFINSYINCFVIGIVIFDEFMIGLISVYEIF